MKEPALRFDSVSIRYESDGPPVLSDVSFVVAPSERVALVGLNGSGKTSLLMAAVGLVPHQGTIRVHGTALERRSLAGIRDRVGFLFNVPEDQLLFPTVIDDTAFGLLRRGSPAAQARDRARKTLDALGAAHLAESPVHHLSHGQKQRVALAGALVTGPDLLLLDEPSAGLDPPGKRALVGILQGLEAAMVIATHDLEFASAVCSRFARIEGGRLVDGGHDFDRLRREWEK